MNAHVPCSLHLCEVVQEGIFTISSNTFEDKLWMAVRATEGLTFDLF
jgi:hypothetical protein